MVHTPDKEVEREVYRSWNGKHCTYGTIVGGGTLINSTERKWESR